MFKRPPSKPGKGNPVDPEPLLALMEQWPNSWAGSDADIPVGNGLVAEMRPFIVHLCSLGLVRSTVRNHLDNCWAIGGEIIRDVVMQSGNRRLPPKKLLLDAIALGDAPLVYGASEEEQRGFDATARKLWKFLNHTAQS
jgi:hypothetical protein